MGEVIRLDERRADRDARVEHRMHSALMHPSLRWVIVEGDATVAHRRDHAGAGAVCGATGTMTLDRRHTPLCPDCYPIGVPRSGT